MRRQRRRRWFGLGRRVRAASEGMRDWRGFEVAPETRRFVLSLLWLLVGALAVFSLFDSAGRVGVWLRPLLFTGLGWGAYIVPFVVTLVALTRFDPVHVPFSRARYVGLGLTIFGGLGLLHLPAPPSEALAFVDEGTGGGYIGFLLSYWLRSAIGGPATVLALALAFFGGIILVINRTPGHLFAWLRARRLERARERLEEVQAAKREEWVEPEGDGGELFDENGETAAEERGVSSDVEESHAVPVFSTRVLDSVRRGTSSRSGGGRVGADGEVNVLPVPPYDPPPLSLLSDASTRPVSADIKVSQQIIQEALKTFDIEVEMGGVSVGPTVTQYTLKPAPGVKLSRLVALHNDLALALAAHPIRIEAPIPGKGLVGIEVPNKAVSIVRLREILTSPVFGSSPGTLVFALGKDVAGEPIVADLERMPHLLIAGATGSGKSVLINSLLVSLLYKNGPVTLKLILIDPKRVELTLYNGISHLLSPVITEPEKAVNALKWAVAEMDRRYELLNATGRRDIASYNRGRRATDMLPQILIVIDELADIMARHAREMENTVTRLAQIARAVGIHLVLATQRPSVDVITGLIKANITTRVAFKVASAVDARTILDTAGAEKLLGSGDMLYLASDHTRPRRVQGAYVAEEEVRRIAAYLARTGDASYDEALTKVPPGLEDVSGDLAGERESDDELYEEARRVVVTARRASTSLLQRHLRIGYARAARLLDVLEKQRIVGPPDGARPREVLVSPPGAPSKAQEGTTEDVDPFDGERGGSLGDHGEASQQNGEGPIPPHRVDSFGKDRS